MTKMREGQSLRQPANRIAELDAQITALFDELHALYRDGLTTEEHNKLWDMVMSDGKSHWS